MSKWLYENEEINSIEQFPKNCHGFVYRITNLENGKIYIGRKILLNTLNKKLTKKELAEQVGPGRKPTKKKVIKESKVGLDEIIASDEVPILFRRKLLFRLGDLT